MARSRGSARLTTIDSKTAFVSEGVIVREEDCKEEMATIRKCSSTPVEIAMTHAGTANKLL